MANWLHELGLFIFAVLAHWQALATGGGVTAAVGMYERKKGKTLPWHSYAFIAGAFCLYSIFAAWQDEHRNTEKVISEKSSFVSQANSCAADLKATQSSLEDKKSLISSLQTAFTASQVPQAQQAANIASCIENEAKLNPQLRERIFIIGVPLGIINLSGQEVTRNALLKNYITELFVMTNEPQARFHGIIRCDSAFTIIDIPTIVAEARGITTYIGAPRQISDHEYEISVEQSSTVWNVTHPAFFRVSSTSESLGTCTFEPAD